MVFVDVDAANTSDTTDIRNMPPPLADDSSGCLLNAERCKGRQHTVANTQGHRQGWGPLCMCNRSKLRTESGGGGSKGALRGGARVNGSSGSGSLTSCSDEKLTKATRGADPILPPSMDTLHAEPAAIPWRALSCQWEGLIESCTRDARTVGDEAPAHVCL